MSAPPLPPLPEIESSQVRNFFAKSSDAKLAPAVVEEVAPRRLIAADQPAVALIIPRRASLSAGRRMPSGLRLGRVEVWLGSVSQLPFSDEMFDLVPAIETHFWWSNLQDGMREISRV